VTKPKPSPKPKTPRNFKHGAYSLLAMRTKDDRPDEGTELGKAFRAAENEYLQDLGGGENASRAMRQLINDSVWCDFLVATMDYQLQGKRQLTRKGKPHPLIELRMTIASHRRNNYRLLGIRRVQKEIDPWKAIQEKYEKKP
jgi:hypothetical protein